MIETRGLTKTFGRKTVVSNLTVRIGAQGVVGFLGRNGAGKTTTMRMLTGFLPMTSGTAVVGGHDVFDAPQWVKQQVGYLPESPPIYPELTVGEFLSFVAELRGVSRSKLWSRIGEVMALVGMTGWEKQLTSTLSKGYRQRLGLAQALLHDPKILILDEPTSGLDPSQLVGIRHLIQQLARTKLVLLSTHILHEVSLLCERILIIEEGKLIGDGTVPELATAANLRPRLEVGLMKTFTGLEGELAKVAGISSVQVNSVAPTLELWIEGDPDIAKDVGKVLAARQIPVTQMRWRTPDLDDVFTTLVGGRHE